jgi:hypothetical protein
MWSSWKCGFEFCEVIKLAIERSSLVYSSADDTLEVGTEKIFYNDSITTIEKKKYFLLDKRIII